MRGWLVRRDEDKFQRIQAHKEFIESCCFSNDGCLLATSSGDETVKVWRLKDLSVWLTFRGHRGVVWDCDFNSSSSLLCSCSSDKTVRVWQIHTAQELTRRQHEATLWVCRFCPSHDNAIATCSSYEDYNILIWDYLQDNILKRIDGHQNIVEDITFSPIDGLTVACCSRDKNVYLWKNCLTSQQQDRILPVILEGHTSRVNSCVFSPLNDTLLVSCSSDTTIILWDTMQEAKVHVMYGHYNAIWSCAFGVYRGHLLLATCSSDRSLRIWDPKSGYELKKLVNFDSLQDPRGQLFCCAFSNTTATNNTLLAVTSLDGGLYVASLDDVISDEIEMLLSEEADDIL